MNIINTYTATSTKELQKIFGKSPQAVSNGVARMLDRNPEHPEWKYKNENTTMISAEGVEWLANYFRFNDSLVVVDERIQRLEMELQHVKAMAAKDQEYIQRLEKIYQERLAEQSMAKEKIYLLEQKSKDEEIRLLKQENERLKNRSLFERIFNK